MNVVRFSPAGNLLASAGDDAGTAGILIYKLSSGPVAQFGMNADDAKYERESWQLHKKLHGSSVEVYDLAWSPDGKYIIAGGTKGHADIFRVSDGQRVCLIEAHKDWIQGVTWDPSDKFIATQSKDRSAVTHAAPQTILSCLCRTMNVYSIEREANAKDGEKLKITLLSKNVRLTSETRSEQAANGGGAQDAEVNGSSSKSTAVKPNTQLLYGDEESTPFFRRLAFSPDGSLLATPAGIYEDPEAALPRTAGTSNGPSSSRHASPELIKRKTSDGQLKAPVRKGKKGPLPTVYLYAQGQLANETPIAHLPGHKTTSVAVKWNPVLWQSRKAGAASIDVKGKGRAVPPQDVEMTADEGQLAQTAVTDGVATHAESAAMDIDGVPQPNGEAVSQGQDDVVEGHGGLFKLPHRMIYAVATHETVLIYDTEQAAPICLFGSLHFAAFTDLSWSSDGLALFATSSDGYASVFAFEPAELGQPCKQQPTRPSPVVENPSPVKSLAAPPQVQQLVARPKSSSVGKMNAAQEASAPITLSSSPQQPQAKTLQARSSDILFQDGPSSSDIADMSVDGGLTSSAVKEKKRAALTFVRPLS